MSETLLTFLLSKEIFNKNKNFIRLVGEKINEPFEKPLHELYKKETCIAPVNSLSYHISRSVPAISEKWEDVWNKYYSMYVNSNTNEWVR